jgi:23S rRNA (uridine2552-2'-O)-methyltransferase
MRREPLAQLFHPRRAGLAVVGGGLHLDELVGGERAVHLGDDRVGETLVADDHDGGEGVGPGAQFAPAGGGEDGHGSDYDAIQAGGPVKRSASSRQWLRRHVNDPFVQRSKKEGYRSRAAYKLIEIDDRDRLLAPGAVVVDLGAAPGGWTQVAVRRAGSRGRVIAVDLLAMEPVPGAAVLLADFSAQAGLAAVEAALAGARADAVLSDMAPNLSGIAVSDQARSMALAELARDFALAHLKPGGVFLVKVFQGAGYEEFLGSLRAAFARVVVRKPAASRGESAELYLLARGLK